MRTSPDVLHGPVARGHRFASRSALTRFITTVGGGLLLVSATLTGCTSTPTTTSDRPVDLAPSAGSSGEMSSATAAASAPSPSSASDADSSTAVIWVNGMGCPLCANNVDEQLAAVPGVESVRINLGTGQVFARLSPSSPPTEQQLATAVNRTGFTLVRIDMPR